MNKINKMFSDVESELKDLKESSGGRSGRVSRVPTNNETMRFSEYNNSESESESESGSESENSSELEYEDDVFNPGYDSDSEENNYPYDT